jgi:CrcB protein
VTWLLVAAGAMIGAPIRYLAGHLFDDVFPAGTLVVNVVGSGLLAWLGTLSLSADDVALLATGFCGALTTYSAFAVHTHDRGWLVGSVYSASTLLLCLGAAVAGALIGHP